MALFAVSVTVFATDRSWTSVVALAVASVLLTVSEFASVASVAKAKLENASKELEEAKGTLAGAVLAASNAEKRILNLESRLTKIEMTNFNKR